MLDFTESLITGLFIRTFLYGVYLVILAHCLRWVFFEDEGWIFRPRPSRLMLTATTLVFALTTANLWIWICRALDAVRNMTSPATTTDHKFIFASNALENATTLLVDAILIYRCWLVYNKYWRVIFLPLLFWLSNIGLFISYEYKSTRGTDERLFIVGLYSCNIFINLYATYAIIYQILRITKRRDFRSDLICVCRDLVQCGLPYLFTNIFSLVVMETQPKSIVFPLSCVMNSAICAIVFNLILIRGGLHRIDTQVPEHWDSLESSGLWFKTSHAAGGDISLDDLKHSNGETV